LPCSSLGSNPDISQNTKWARHNQRSGQNTLARQKNKDIVKFYKDKTLMNNIKKENNDKCQKQKAYTSVPID
jgi:hypothetical protein